MITYEEALLVEQENPSIKKQVLGDLTLFTYLYADEAVSMNRDLRGIIFDNTDGSVASLPFHKFYNVGEVPLPEDIGKGTYTEKLDGSLLQATYHKGRLIAASRSSMSGYVNKEASHLLTDALKLYMQKYPEYTFLFEFLDPAHPIVIQHNVRELVFLVARNKITGKYSSFTSIPCRQVEHFNIRNVDRLKSEVENQVDKEGYVLYLDNDLYKLKSPWYFQLHTIITKLGSRAIIESWANDSLDDLKGYLFLYGGERLERLKSIERRLNDAVLPLLHTMYGAAHNSAETPKEAIEALNSVVDLNAPLPKALLSCIMKSFRAKESEGYALTEFKRGITPSQAKYLAKEIFPELSETSLWEGKE